MRTISRCTAVFPVLLAMVLTTCVVQANQNTHDKKHRSPYADETNRQIRSLSADDISELTRGGGWGLARAAELNGMPGPIHLLEMKDEIGLSMQQQDAIQNIYRTMKVAATQKGKDMIELETELDQRFKLAKIDEGSLSELVSKIARVRGELRIIHLTAHLKTLPVLTEAQVLHYNSLRGYGQLDPCSSVPEGHSEAMWRKHNGCN